MARSAPSFCSLILSALALLAWGNSVAGGEPAAAGPRISSETKAHSLADREAAAARRLAAEVTIFRDAWGAPHVDGQNDRAAAFGFAYAQAEDYFWQVEDSYILSLGRYSEVHGPRGLNSDLLNRAFEVVPRARAYYLQLEPELKAICEGFAAGLNYYLQTHPNIKPRLLNHFEPWYVLTLGRHMTLELCFRRTGLSNNYLPRSNEMIWAGSGSNGWAVAPARTASGHAMLMVNPHLPWFGFGQLFEAHVRSVGRWDFTGATTYGNPLFTLGHNERLGWTLTTNEPDIADLWRVEFDDPQQPLNYRFGAGYRTATEWRESIAVRTAGGVDRRSYTLRKTHFGPIVDREDNQTFLAARIAGLEDTLLMRQSLAMMRAGSYAEFRRALEMQQHPLMNILYADQQGNILFLYNGLIPRRDDQFDWSEPVDGADPRTVWQGPLKLDELPQVLNPACGYVQNCNSSPFTTCEEGNPAMDKFPRYLAQDAEDDKRRAKRSRQMLGAMQHVTFDELQTAAFDTTVYWAIEELPRYKQRFKELKADDSELAAQVAPYLDHLLDWDGRITADSTAATLCEAWYTELYGRGYPAETLRPRYAHDVTRQFQALPKVANQLTTIHGDWRVRWADAFRMQRHAQRADLIEIPFDDRTASTACLAGPGPMGVIFTQYYSPSLKIPFIKTLRRRYAIIGPSYLAVYEFGPKIRGATAVTFGASSDPASPHFQDQTQLLAERRLKPELFDWNEIAQKAAEQYHPGARQQ